MNLGDSKLFDRLTLTMDLHYGFTMISQHCNMFAGFCPGTTPMPHHFLLESSGYTSHILHKPYIQSYRWDHFMYLKSSLIVTAAISPWGTDIHQVCEMFCLSNYYIYIYLLPHLWVDRNHGRCGFSNRPTATSEEYPKNGWNKPWKWTKGLISWVAQFISLGHFPVHHGAIGKNFPSLWFQPLWRILVKMGIFPK